MKKFFLQLLFLPCCLIAAEKVVSLSPAVTELILYAGGKDLLCGRSSVCDDPSVRDLPVAGDLGRPVVEAVLKSGAGMVICDIRHPGALWKKLEKCGIKVVMLPAEKLSDLPDNVEKTGKVLNLPEAAGKAAGLRKRIEKLKQDSPAIRYRVVVLFSVSPLVTCGKESFISEALSLAGLDNAAGSAGKGYFILSAEYLCRLDPEVILLAGVPEEAAARYFRHPVFRDMAAVRHGRIVHLDANRWSRLTPGIIQAAEELKLRSGSIFRAAE